MVETPSRDTSQNNDEHTGGVRGDPLGGAGGRREFTGQLFLVNGNPSEVTEKMQDSCNLHPRLNNYWAATERRFEQNLAWKENVGRWTCWRQGAASGCRRGWKGKEPPFHREGGRRQLQSPQLDLEEARGAACGGRRVEAAAGVPAGRDTRHPETQRDFCALLQGLALIGREVW